jgi:predicted CXXCH cytochrome family protein
MSTQPGSREVHSEGEKLAVWSGQTTINSRTKRKEVRTVRRLMLLVAVGTLWLFLAAIPAFADGGPHNKSINNGATSITADGCAGCHRAHTAKEETALLIQPEEQLCRQCHGPGALGATTNVWNGVQFDMGATPSDRDASAIVGALRNGGFLTAAIGSSQAVKLSYSADSNGNGTRMRPKVPANTVGGVLSGEPVTSAHLAVDGATGVTLSGTVWGNGTSAGQGAGATTATMSCTGCHNPHGNGAYRILNAIPEVSGSGDFAPPAVNVTVTDGPPVPAGDTRNYTIIQTVSGSGNAITGTWSNTSLTVNSITATNVAGDYMHRYNPWNATATGTYTIDRPNDQVTFNTEITAWCLQCHTRYMSTDYSANSGDPIFTYKHGVNAERGNSCVTCHVGHGSNASMTGDYSSAFPYPNGSPSDSSRLLKIDNRGTCSVCHDPTTSLTVGVIYPAAPITLYP